MPPRIDKEAGLKMVVELGYKMVGVAVSTVEDRYIAISGYAVILGVHLTDISGKDINQKSLNPPHN